MTRTYTGPDVFDAIEAARADAEALWPQGWRFISITAERTADGQPAVTVTYQMEEAA